MLKYRAEVDGLRALAILPVLAHHAHFPFLPGGFLGVDVFFVISGYLISSIIAGDMAQGRFSLARFYERRARRILPALFTVCLASCVAAWFLMMPAGILDFSYSLLSVLLFASNFYFWQDRDYFHPDVDAYPLLHTWSLAVEEQFYLLFPLLLMLAWRLGPRGLLMMIGMGCVLSLGLSEWAARYAPVGNFFLAPTRAWELGIGAMLGLQVHRQPQWQLPGAALRHLWPWLGLLMVVVPMQLYTDRTTIPGLPGLIPVLGTAVLLASASSQTLVGRLLASRILVGFGLISYSLYLWHQPLYAFLRMTQLQQPTSLQFGLAIALSIALATLSWRFIEAPFRNAQSISRRQLIASGCASFALLAGFATAAILSQGFSNRPAFQGPLLGFDARSTVGASWAAIDNYQSGGNPVRVAVVGNSHAKDVYNMLRLNPSADTAEIEFVPIITNPICAARRGLSSQQRENCRLQLLEHLQPSAQYSGFILAPDWTVRGMNSALRLLEQQKDSNKPILVMQPGPRFSGLIPLLQKSARYGPSLQVGEQLARETENHIHHRKTSRLLRYHLDHGRAEFVDRRKLACPTDRCEFFTPEGDLAYYDDSHLTVAGAAHFGRRLGTTPGFRRFLEQLRGPEIGGTPE